MTASSITPPVLSRRDRQREETRRDLAVAAFELVVARGLANVRVPDIAAAAGVSTRTFNNYFTSKEAAIAWPASQRAARMVTDLLERPEAESLGDALVATVVGLYQGRQPDGLPAQWLREFRTLVAAEPSLLGEYLKTSADGERALAGAIEQRVHGSIDGLRARVLAAMVVGAERAAVMHWIQRNQRGSVVELVRAAVQQAVTGADQLR